MPGYDKTGPQESGPRIWNRFGRCNAVLDSEWKKKANLIGNEEKESHMELHTYPEERSSSGLRRGSLPHGCGQGHCYGRESGVHR